MNNPFDYRPDSCCMQAYADLRAHIEELRQSDLPGDAAFCREVAEGKMIGVMIARDAEGSLHRLFAFSGQLGSDGFHRAGFVEPAFDYLRPDGYFKMQEADISRRNREIERFEQETVAGLRASFEIKRRLHEEELERWRERYRESKCRRDDLRRGLDTQSAAGVETLRILERESQHEKAEMRRLKKCLSAELAPYSHRLEEAVQTLRKMKEKRREDSEALQSWLFDNFTLMNAKGESRSLSEIFADTPMGVPPSGAGECCAPKLLQAAYRRGWNPVSMAEFWIGKSNGGEVRRDGAYYPACRGKCLPILSWMLQGLEVEPPLRDGQDESWDGEPRVVFENELFCVIDKPAGMLSVPGKGGADSAQRWLERRFGGDRVVKVAHRLDRDTSGLLIATFSDAAYRLMQRLFATRQVVKTYEALLEGDWRERGLSRRGRIELPLVPDWLDRPRQRVDVKEGKEALTDYEFGEVESGQSRVVFHPLTGRTHQLRVHAASCSGLSMPIAGDPLYAPHAAIAAVGGPARGECCGEAGRMMLHARRIEFRFPEDGPYYNFESPTPF